MPRSGAQGWQPRGSGLQPLQGVGAGGCRRPGWFRGGPGLQLEIPSLLGAAGTSEQPLFCLNVPFSPGFWRTMDPTVQGGNAILGSTEAPGGPWSPGRLATTTWAQVEEPRCCQGTSTCNSAHAVLSAWNALEICVSARHHSRPCECHSL